MTSELSIFAAQLREFIRFQLEETSSIEPEHVELLASHADAEFNGYAMLLFALQFKANAPYRKFCESRSITPDALTHWTQIPAVPASAFKELEFTCLPAEQRTRVFHSSGTTEQKPSRHFHSPESLGIYEESLWPWFERCVLGNLKSQISNLKLLSLTPPLEQAPHSSLVYMFETIRRKLGAPESTFVGRVSSDGSWTLELEALLDATRNTQHATLLLGTAFSFVHLLDFMAERALRIQLPPGSCVMETGGYKGRSRSLPKQELHALITERLGVPPSHIVCEYGMSELSSQAYDVSFAGEPTPDPSQEGNAFHATRNTQHATRSFHFPPWARAQVISPETGREVADGETGLIRVTDLANVFSVMAIQTEDLAVRRGNGFELIGRAELAEARGCSLMTV